ncbi:NAD(P)-binding protein [Kocuria carniphila]|uniref:NAD(P)-binding protein n=1 Tax=Kocuria carniphila TaxID=262208 RepID=A0ABV3V5V2_9MICC
MTSIAIAGSGPNGLTAACGLATAGMDVSVFERACKPGGACPV